MNRRKLLFIPVKTKTATLRHENKYYRRGAHHIFGFDEAGKGPIAGPVYAGCVCLPLAKSSSVARGLRGVRDSKAMTIKQRTELVETIQSIALTWGVGKASPSEIDQTDIISATFLAYQRALQAALHRSEIQPDLFFLDYELWPEPPGYEQVPQVSIVRGDKMSLTIAAASVLAKTARDAEMIELADDYPLYGFEKHKGYGTPTHLSALQAHGPCDIHRRSTKPVASAEK